MKNTLNSETINVIFDLDGTLIDSQLGIIQSLKFALSDSGFNNKVVADQIPIGPPLLELVQSYTGCDEPTVVNPIISKFKEYYDKYGYKSSHLFDGVSGFLQDLNSASFRLFVATNKRHRPTLKILRHLNINNLFNAVYAIDTFEERFKSKSSMLKSLISDYPLNSNIVYIGDRYDDYTAARSNSILFCFPHWGYTDEHHLFPNDTIGVKLGSPDEIKKLVQQNMNL